MPIPKSQPAIEFEQQESTCLDRALEIVHDRGKKYGHPTDVYVRVAMIWSAILGVEVSPVDVGLCLMGLKLGREAENHQRDNVDDMAGYAWVLEAVQKRGGTW